MSICYGHSLKGYQWYNDEGIVLMSFTFKDLTLDIWQDTNEKELQEFKNYIEDKGWEIHHINTFKHTIEESD